MILTTVYRKSFSVPVPCFVLPKPITVLILIILGLLVSFLAACIAALSTEK